MKKGTAIMIVLACFVVISACKKESVQSYPKYYAIPSSKNISTLNLLGSDVDVEWVIAGQDKVNFTSTVSQVYYLQDSVPVIVINGSFPSINSIYFNDISQLSISLLFEKEKQNAPKKILSVKPVFIQEAQTWNGMSTAEVGVYEDFNQIVITSNGIFSPNSDYLSMCMKIVIHKQRN